MRPVLQKCPRYENRRYLNLSHDAPCFCNLRDVCLHPITGCVPAHANWQAFGRGHGYKSHDIFTIPACTGVTPNLGCHWFLDYGTRHSQEEKIETFERGLDRYIRWLLAQRRIVLDVPMAEMQMILDGGRGTWLKAWQEGRAKVAGR